MAGPWEKYQTEAPAEAPVTEAVPVQPAPISEAQVAAPAAASEGPWSKYYAPVPVEKKTETATAEDTSKKWAEEHPVLGRVASALHGAGELIPGREKLSAGLHALTEGGPGDFSEKYERAKRAQERAGKALSEAYPMTHFAGSIAPMLTPVGAEAMLAGEGALARGAGKLLPSLSPSAKTMAGISGFGGVYGAAQGAAEGDTADERLKNALTGAGIGAAMGPIGAGIGKVGRSIFGPAGKTATQEAAEGLGIEAPRFVTSEAPVQHTLAAGVKAIPFAGEKIGEASRDLNNQLEEKILSLAGSTIPNPEGAGERLKSGIKNWIGQEAPEEADKLYDAVRETFKKQGPPRPGPMGTIQPVTDLNNVDYTKQVYNDLMGLRAESKDFEMGKVLKQLTEAVSDPNGMTFNGMQRLRRRVGEALRNKDTLASEGINHDEANALYGALSSDLKNAALKQGGVEGVAALRKADREFAIANAKKARLRKIIGYDDERFSDEQIFENLANLARGKGGNLKRLELAKNTLSPNDWNTVTSNMIHKLGQTTGEHGKDFSPAKFLTEYNKLSPGGLDVMFGPKGSPYRQNMDWIATMAKSIGEAGSAANTSKTAHVNETLNMFKKLGTLGALGMGLHEAAGQSPEAAGTELATGVGGGWILASMLASPRGAFAVREWMQKATPQAGQAITDEIARISGRVPKASRYALQSKLVNNMTDREHRASGGKVGNRDYPAKRLTRMEKALKRAQDAMSLETKSLMQIPDAQIAHALDIAKDK